MAACVAVMALSALAQPLAAGQQTPQSQDEKSQAEQPPRQLKKRAKTKRKNRML